MENPPSQSVYVRNLNEKIRKDELRASLYYLFSQYGQILDVVALKTQKMRGQAFVVFRDISSATNAVRSLENFNFFGKPIRLAYARGKSHAFARFRGEVPGAASDDKKKPREKRKATDDGGKPAKKVAKPADSEAAPAAASAATASEAGAAEKSAAAAEKPNKILFCSNLPDESRETSESMLSMLFQQFPGYKEVRLIEGRHDIAFVEFENDAESATARDALQGFRISPQHLMKIEYAKK